MRVTISMMTGKVLDNLAISAEKLLAAQDRASSGKKIRRPSDDITGVGRALDLRSAISAADQYLRNAGIVRNQLTATSSALDTIAHALQDVRTRAVATANSSVNDEARAGIASYLDQVMNSLVAAGNTQHMGKYILSGSLTNIPAIVPNGAGPPPYLYQGNTAQFILQIAPANYVTVNTTADEVFNMGGIADPTAPDVFETIRLLREEILADDIPAISARIADIDANLANVNCLRAQVGTRVQRLDATENMLLDSKTSLSELLSKTEDVDLAEAVLELRTRENVYTAAASTAGRVLNLSLVNFLK